MWLKLGYGIKWIIISMDDKVRKIKLLFNDVKIKILEVRIFLFLMYRYNK